MTVLVGVFEMIFAEGIYEKRWMQKKVTFVPQQISDGPAKFGQFLRLSVKVLVIFRRNYLGLRF